MSGGMEFTRGNKNPLHSMGVGMAQVIFDKTTKKDDAAYSYGLYYKDIQWMKIIQYLLTKGYSPFETEQVMRSKLMRWTSDHSGKRWATLRDFIKYNEDERNSATDQTAVDNFIYEYIDREKQMLKEDAMGGVSAPMATLNNVPGMGNAVPAGVGKMGSGDKWGNTIGKKPYTQSAGPKKKKKKKKLEEENINPYDKLGTAMAKKMGVKIPFKKKKDKKNQNSMTQTKMGEMKIMPFEEFKELYENYRLNGITYDQVELSPHEKVLVGKEGILGYKGNLVPWNEIKQLMKKYGIS